MDPVGALRRERTELMRMCRDLDAGEWKSPSAAPGWRVQDVVAHMGSAFHAMFSPKEQKDGKDPRGPAAEPVASAHPNHSMISPR